MMFHHHPKAPPHQQPMRQQPYHPRWKHLQHILEQSKKIIIGKRNRFCSAIVWDGLLFLSVQSALNWSMKPMFHDVDIVSGSFLIPRVSSLTSLFCSSKCLQRTVESHHRCPKCQLSLQSSDIFPNYTRSFPNFCYQRRRRFSFSSQCDHRKVSSTTSITTNVWQIWRKRRERRRRAGGKNYGDCLEYRWSHFWYGDQCSRIEYARSRTTDHRHSPTQR